MSRAKGFDSSYHNHGNVGQQRPIDFEAAVAGGFSFWIGRIVDAFNAIDVWIERDFRAASATRMRKLVYHVVNPALSPAVQVAKLLEGLRLLDTPPDGIALDVERGNELGAAAVTRAYREHVLAIRQWWGGKLVLYSNLNYLRYFITDRMGLDIWIAWPAEDHGYNPVDEPPVEGWVMYQRSWREAIPGVPDASVDLDEFNGDEAAMNAYLGDAVPPSEPPEEEDEMAVREKLLQARALIDEVLVELESEPPAPPPAPPPVPPPGPTTATYLVTADKSLANWAKDLNDAGRPVMAIYETPRYRYDEGDRVPVLPGLVAADGGSRWYEIYAVKGGKGEKLYLDRTKGVLV